MKLKTFVAQVSTPEYAIEYIERMALCFEELHHKLGKTERDYGKMSGYVHALAEYTGLSYAEIRGALLSGTLAPKARASVSSEARRVQGA